MKLGRKSIWIGAAAGITLSVGVVSVAAGADADDAPVQAAAADAVPLVDDTVPRIPAPTTTTTEAPKPKKKKPKATTTTTAAPAQAAAASAPAPAPAPTAPPTTQAPPPPPPPTTAPPPPPPPPPPSTNATRSTSCESYMYNQINASRAANGKGALAFDSGIQYIAVDWSDHMAGTQNLAHNPNYGSQIARHRAYSRAAENVGRGYDQASLYQAFMNSAGHRANILGDFSHVTVGCVTDGSGQYWVTHNFWG